MAMDDGYDAECAAGISVLSSGSAFLEDSYQEIPEIQVKQLREMENKKKSQGVSMDSFNAQIDEAIAKTSGTIQAEPERFNLATPSETPRTWESTSPKLDSERKTFECPINTGKGVMDLSPTESEPSPIPIGYADREYSDVESVRSRMRFEGDQDDEVGDQFCSGMEESVSMVPIQVGQDQMNEGATFPLTLDEDVDWNIHIPPGLGDLMQMREGVYLGRENWTQSRPVASNLERDNQLGERPNLETAGMIPIAAAETVPIAAAENELIPADDSNLIAAENMESIASMATNSAAEPIPIAAADNNQLPTEDSMAIGQGTESGESILVPDCVTFNYNPTQDPNCPWPNLGKPQSPRDEPISIESSMDAAQTPKNGFDAASHEYEEDHNTELESALGKIM